MVVEAPWGWNECVWRVRARSDQLQMKTPKYSSKANWKDFYAQFELLVRAAGWSEEIKALQLTLCLVACCYLVQKNVVTMGL